MPLVQLSAKRQEVKLAEPNTIRRPQNPSPTYIGPVLEAGGQWGFHFYQPALNSSTPIWFAQPSKADATLLRNKLAKQPQAFHVTQPLLEAIKHSIQEAAQHKMDQDVEDEETV